MRFPPPGSLFQVSLPVDDQGEGLGNGLRQDRVHHELLAVGGNRVRSAGTAHGGGFEQGVRRAQLQAGALLANVHRHHLLISRKDGKELFFFSTDQQMMAVDVSQKGASLQLGAPHALFKATTVSGPSGPYTVSADGEKFVMNTVLPQSITEPLTLIINWQADLKQ